MTSCTLDFWMLNGVHTFWIMLTAVLDYISCAWVDHIFCDRLLYIHSFIFEWLNLNHFPSLCDHHWLPLPTTVKQFSVLLATECFPICLVYIIIQEQSFWSLGGHLCLIFENEWKMTARYRECTVYVLTLNVRGPSYLGLTSSISWLLVPWLLRSPGHQQPWYWLIVCRIGRFLSYLTKDFNYLRHINVEEWHKM